MDNVDGLQLKYLPVVYTVRYTLLTIIFVYLLLLGNGCECSEENDSRTCPGTDFEYGNICFPNGAATECAIQPVRCPEYDDDDCML